MLFKFTQNHPFSLNLLGQYACSSHFSQLFLKHDAVALMTPLHTFHEVVHFIQDLGLKFFTGQQQQANVHFVLARKRDIKLVELVHQIHPSVPR